MNVCLSGMVKNNLEELKGKRWKEMNPVFCVQTMNDALKIILEAKPEEVAAIVADFREFFCIDKYPPIHYGTITRGGSTGKPPVFGQLP